MSDPDFRLGDNTCRPPPEVLSQRALGDMGGVHKTRDSQMWARFCHSCRHEAVPGSEMPCRNCWNPPGDMYSPKAASGAEHPACGPEGESSGVRGSVARRRPTIDEYLMELAEVAAKRTTCVRKGVGCVLADSKGRVLAIAYNGVASGMPHCNDPDGLHRCEGSLRPFGQPTSCAAVHAEQNAVLQCKDPDAIVTAYVTTAPCRPCAKLLLNTGCKRIVFLDDHAESGEAQAIWEKAGREWVQLRKGVA